MRGESSSRGRQRIEGGVARQARVIQPLNAQRVVLPCAAARQTRLSRCAGGQGAHASLPGRHCTPSAGPCFFRGSFLGLPGPPPFFLGTFFVSGHVAPRLCTAHADGDGRCTGRAAAKCRRGSSVFLTASSAASSSCSAAAIAPSPWHYCSTHSWTTFSKRSSWCTTYVLALACKRGPSVHERGGSSAVCLRAGAEPTRARRADAAARACGVCWA